MSDAPTHRPHVAYVLKQYPRLSETFILNEILGLEQAETTISIFSLRHATEGRFHPAIASVKANVHYVGQPDKQTFIDAMRTVAELRLDALPDALDFLDTLPADRRCRVLIQAIEIAREVQRRSIDHLHAHFLTVAAHTAHLVHLLIGVSYSVTAHAKDIYRHTVDWEIAARVARSATAVVTVCDANLAYLSHRLDGADANLVRIYNGLGPQDPPTSTMARIPALVLGVGRLVEKKGFDLLLRAAASLRSEIPHLRVVLAGDGDQRTALETLATQLGISDRVEFLGAVSQTEVSRLLRSAEVLVAPCRVGTDGNQDALPTVLIEALAAGLPSISTPVAGIPEIVSDGVEGSIVDTEDADAVAVALRSLLADDALRRSMSLAGPIKVRQRFHRQRSVEALLETFDVLERI